VLRLEDAIGSRLHPHRADGREPNPRALPESAGGDLETSGPDRQFLGRRDDARASPFFRKHHRPCGQPAVDGGTRSFRPLPAQAGHFMRINATPSDLPLMSAGLATYPVPPQRGQSFGAIIPLNCQGVFHRFHRATPESKSCYETRTELRPYSHARRFHFCGPSG